MHQSILTFWSCSIKVKSNDSNPIIYTIKQSSEKVKITKYTSSKFNINGKYNEHKDSFISNKYKFKFCI